MEMSLDQIEEANQKWKNIIQQWADKQKLAES